MGQVKYFVKQMFVKPAIAAGFKAAVKNKMPNQVAFFVKP
jgi:hypothetical protein